LKGKRLNILIYFLLLTWTCIEIWHIFKVFFSKFDNFFFRKPLDSWHKIPRILQQFKIWHKKKLLTTQNLGPKTRWSSAQMILLKKVQNRRYAKCILQPKTGLLNLHMSVQIMFTLQHYTIFKIKNQQISLLYCLNFQLKIHLVYINIVWNVQFGGQESRLGNGLNGTCNQPLWFCINWDSGGQKVWLVLSKQANRD
jgi:hypothetical protein